jgi:hypothetical protein
LTFNDFVELAAICDNCAAREEAIFPPLTSQNLRVMAGIALQLRTGWLVAPYPETFLIESISKKLLPV